MSAKNPSTKTPKTPPAEAAAPAGPAAIDALLHEKRVYPPPKEFRDKANVVPIIEKATDKPRDAVEYAIDVLTKNCIWSINTGFDPARTQWSIDNSAENGDLEKDRKPTVEQVANIQLAKEAVEAAGGPVTIGNCKD